MSESRVHKSLLNAKVNLVFYFLSLFFAFFSRKIFLDNLGAEFIGLTGTLGNILGYLNLAEMGIGIAVGFTLYKPIQSKDREAITEIVSIFGYLYRRIAMFILLGGFVVSLAFPLIFNGTSLGLGIVYFAFISSLLSSVMGYLLNYREILLSTDQKHYLVSIYFQSSSIAKTVIQILLAYIYANLYLWVGTELLFSFLGCIILNWKIDKVYPWLRPDVKNGKQLLKKYPTILKSTRQVFIHQIKDFLLGRTDEILIFAFVSLKMVAFYGNYTLIVQKVSMLFRTVLDSVGAGVGNLVAEGNKESMMKVFWELMAIRHFIAGFLVFTIYFFIEPFISIWLGNKYVIDHTILICLVIHMYIYNSRGVVDIFNNAYGHYSDVWSAWTELAINLTVTIIFGLRYGIVGILLGKIVSTITIVVLWKPYYLFSQGFHLPISIYWKGTLRYLAIFLTVFTMGHLLCAKLTINPYNGFASWILFAIIMTSMFVITQGLMFYAFTLGTRSLLKRIKLPKFLRYK